jgi:glutamate--cysteine ligase
MSRLNREKLIHSFESYGSPRPGWLIGGEFERAVVHKDGSPVTYDEPRGIRWILEQLAALQGWDIQREEGRPIALWKDGASITLEPGGQVELSGAPHQTLTALNDEMCSNRDALLQLAEGEDLHWIACGLTPIAGIEDIRWMPKSRYDVMRAYLPSRGELAEYMMKATCSVQCNYDYRDEKDCARKVRLCAGLAPLTTAMFSNSPLYKNRPTGFKSYRGHIWSRTDPERCGFPAAIRSDWSIEAWVDYLLEVPMMFFHRDGLYLPAKGRSFRSFMEDGIDGHFAQLEDWDLHQTSVFPEVRVKRTIEVRGADCVNTDLALAFCALFTGLLYCDIALDEGLDLVAEIERHGTHGQRLALAAEGGMAGAFGGRRIADWASDLGEIAERGLTNCLPGDLDKLQPLLQQIEDGRSPADDLLDAWSKDPSPESVLRAVAY